MSHFLCLSFSELSSMDGVPLKMPQGSSQEVKKDVKVIVPDYLNILQETEVCVFLLSTVCDTNSTLLRNILPTDSPHTYSMHHKLLLYSMRWRSD